MDATWSNILNDSPQPTPTQRGSWGQLKVLYR
jgi:hypothetical protein